MRLLNVDTFQLEEFLWKKPPPYAILSHTWGPDNEEVSYQDAVSGKQEKIRTRKLVGCCKLAKTDGLQYVWIDTCCIDKANSVELQEAINSMFRWYQQAAICYAYLSDVPFRDRNRDRDKHFDSVFSASRWFQRGWTLQELLAPLKLRFYDSSWHCLGTKGDLCGLVEEITGIPTSFLLGITELHHASVAQRMSWAAKRVTKRQEDTAYCLLGIFGVSMPMIYGEGDRAFRRLQEQIMKDIEDDSILAWDLHPGRIATLPDAPDVPGTVLAPAPSYFANSGSVVVMDQSAQSSVEVQGGSLRVALGLYYTSDERTLGLLKCGIEEQGVRSREGGLEQGVVRIRVGIPLTKAPGTQHNKYFRLADRSAELVGHSGPEIQNTLVQIQLDGGRNAPSAVAETFWIHVPKSVPNLELIDVHPPASWHKDRALIEATFGTTTTDVQRILVRFRGGRNEVADFVALLEPQNEGQLGCSLMIISRKDALKEIADYSGTVPLRLSGNTTATNGQISLGFKLETSSKSLSQPSFVLRLSSLSDTPSGTVNATAELQLASAKNILMDLRAASEAQNGEAKALRDRIKDSKGKVARKQAELDALRDKILALQQQEQHLVEELKTELESAKQLDNLTGRMKKEEAAVWERIEGLKQLIDFYDGKVELEDNGGVVKAAGQILPFAIARGHDSLARLLHRKATSEERDLAGKTPLEHANSRGPDEFVQFLVRRTRHRTTSVRARDWGEVARPGSGNDTRAEATAQNVTAAQQQHKAAGEPLLSSREHAQRSSQIAQLDGYQRSLSKQYRAATNVTIPPSNTPRPAAPYRPPSVRDDFDPASRAERVWSAPIQVSTHTFSPQIPPTPTRHDTASVVVTEVELPVDRVFLPDEPGSSKKRSAWAIGKRRSIPDP